MIKFIQETNGTMTLDDLKNYKVAIRQPVSISYRGFRAFSTSSPSSGAVCLSLLKTMEQYPASESGGTNLTMHRFSEAVRRVLEHGASMADAIAAPRLHDQLMPNQVTFEYTFDNATVASMVEKGHNVTWVRLGVSAVQGIRRRPDGTFEAAGEPRQLNSGGMTT